MVEKYSLSSGYCCQEMEQQLASQMPSIAYNSKIREFSLPLSEERVQIIGFCPWCGVELPTSLRDEWFAKLSDVLGEEFDIMSDRENVPATFQTDEWWRTSKDLYSDEKLERFCCKHMFFHLNEKEKLIRHDHAKNEFGVLTFGSSEAISIRFCPWCREDLHVGKRTIHKKSLYILHPHNPIPGRVLYMGFWEPSTIETQDTCCATLEQYINSGQAVLYQKTIRGFSCPVRESVLQEIWGCPWCGEALPQELSNEWYDLLENKFGEDFDPDEDYEKIPEEFTTDEWWRSRSLSQDDADNGKSSCCRAMSSHLKEGILTCDKSDGGHFIDVCKEAAPVQISFCPFCGEQCFTS